MQKHSSKNTSIKTVNAVYTQTIFPIPCEAIILDYGGGKYDDNKNYVKRNYRSNLMVYDPYNRSPEYNSEVLRIMSRIYPDLVVCSNVLNVIDNRAEIKSVLEHIVSLKPKHVLFAIYEGDKSGIGKESRPDCWQRNEKTEKYLPLIRKYFKNAVRRGNLIYC